MTTITVYGDLMNETEKAWRFAPDGDEDRAIWVPKSLAEWQPDHEDAVSGDMEVPEWFATKEGMI